MKGLTMGLGKNIVKRRKELNINAAELCRRVGIRSGYMSEIETEKKVPSTDILIKIARALTTSVSNLLEENASEKTFIKENIDLIRGNMTYEEMSKDMGTKLNEPAFSDLFSPKYLKEVAKGNFIPDRSRIITFSKYAQVPEEFFYKKNNSIEDVILAREEYELIAERENNESSEGNTLSHYSSKEMEFLRNPNNKKYVEFAIEIKEKGIDPDDIFGFNLKRK
jgi:transcriptional regulator with XRE-family HTH domain